MEDRVLRAAGDVIGDLVGLRSTSATEARLAASLRERSDAVGLDLGSYVDRLRTDGRERQQLLERLTVQETSFFRESAQLEAFARQIVPSLRPGPLVVWSAGCATGQEPYSLAMLLLELGITEFGIVASDISATALERARSGVYRRNELRGLSDRRRDRWFREVDGGWRIVDEVRTRIRFVQHNLANDPPPVGAGECAAVFCRNVFIYLRRERITACVEGMHSRLAPGGVLFLGASESMWPADPRFTLSRVSDGVFCYRRTADVAPAVPKPSTRAAAAAGAAGPPVRPRTAPRSSTRPAPAPAIDLAEVRRDAEAASRSGQHALAVELYRKVVYLDPGDPVAHLQLGLALEASGDPASGSRAFLAARAALEKVDAASVEATLEGWGVEVVAAVLDAKLGGAR